MSVKAWAQQFNTMLPPITKAQKRYHAKMSEKYLFINNKNGDCTCPKCEKMLHLGKTKHKSVVICPECSKELIVQHTWRMSEYLEVINWMVIPKAIDSHTLCLRFVLAYQKKDGPMEVNEAGRMFIDEYRAEPEYYCINMHNKWTKGRSPYFRTDSYMTPNRFDCHGAYEYPRNFFKEINKLDCFKYYPAENEYNFRSYVTQLHYTVRSARINEKLIKAGFESIAKYHKNYYMQHGDRTYSLNYKATSLMDMLKLNKSRFKLLKESPSYTTLSFLQSNSNVNEDLFRSVNFDSNKYNKILELAKVVGVTWNKMLAYLNKSEINCYEYSHYLSVAKELGYDIKDSYYSMPKNFRTADTKITEEHNKKLDEERIAKLSAKDVLIKKVSDGLRQMPGLQEFLNGSNGLLVYIPESAKDLVEEGRAQNNCIGTYVDRIANGKTMVFFVRRLNDPTAPFVDFEYYNGEVVQCRYNHNVAVKDTEIIDFVNRFADVLRKVG